MTDLGPMLRQRRTALGLTLTAAAETAGITKGYLSMIETGKVAHPPARPVLLALEHALRLAPGTLLAAADRHNTPPTVRQELRRLRLLARSARDLAALLRPVLMTRGPARHAPERITLAGPTLRLLRARVAAIQHAARPNTPAGPDDPIAGDT
jgi:transcriptional regulator with XRE-family HTH domain